MKKYLEGAWHIFVASWRQFCYNNIPILLRSHIVQQIEERFCKANKKCYQSGACIQCGCATPALFFASKACAGNCYPPLHNRKKWRQILRLRELVKQKRRKKYGKILPTTSH